MFLLKDKKDKRVVYLGLEIKVTECEGNTVSMSSCKKYNNGGDHPSDFMEIDAIHFRCVDSKAGRHFVQCTGKSEFSNGYKMFYLQVLRQMER